MKGEGVSVVIVNYNTRDALRRCLECLGDPGPQLEIIVVDNASADGSVEMVSTSFPKVILIESPTNLGFGPANNLGHERATRPLVLYLNSDAYAQANAVTNLASAFDDASVVAAGGKLLNMDGSLQNSTTEELTLWRVFCEQTFLDKLLQRIDKGYWNTGSLLRQFESSRSPVDSEQVTGACIMVRRETPVLFDDRYFLYCEDTDLCKRLRALGRIVYNPEAEFFHELGTSSSKNRWLAVARYNLGKEIYFGVHHSSFQRLICALFNRLGAVIRLAGWLLSALFTLGLVPKFRSQVSLFWRVLTARSTQIVPRTAETNSPHALKA